MKKIIKSISTVVLALVGIYTMIVSAYAEENAHVNSFDDYLRSMIPIYLNARNISIEGILEYSQSIPIYNSITGEHISDYTFLFNGESIFAKIETAVVNGSYVSVFDTVVTQDLQNAYTNNDDIMFCKHEYGVYMVTSFGECVFIDGNQNSKTKNDIRFNMGTKNKITKNSKSILLNVIQTKGSLGSKYLSVGHVGNSQTSSGIYLCWAACVAMTANYMDGDSYSALGVYNTISSSYSGNSLGSPSCVSKAYVNCVNSSFSYTSGALAPSTVFDNLDDEKPVQINIKGTSGGVWYYHAVLITGIHLYSSQTVYTVDDPNYSSGTRTFSASGNPVTATSSISYLGMDGNGGSMTYTNWYRTFN